MAGAKARAGQYARPRGIMRMAPFVPQRLNQPKNDARSAIAISVKNTPRKEAKKSHTASRALAELCYFIRGRPMSRASPHTPSTVSLADEEAVRRILVDTLFGLWATVNNLTRLRPSRHERYRVTMFGSARTEPGHWVYEEVKQMCLALI